MLGQAHTNLKHQSLKHNTSAWGVKVADSKGNRNRMEMGKLHLVLPKIIITRGIPDMVSSLEEMS